MVFIYGSHDGDVKKMKMFIETWRWWIIGDDGNVDEKGNDDDHDEFYRVMV